ncbi:MAG: 1-phosphofructokinase family hexose kinase [Mycoplasmatales bacterium]
MIFLISFNPAIDVYFELETFEVGKTNRMVTRKRELGGKALNVANVLYSLDVDFKLLTLTSNKEAIFMEEKLKDFNCHLVLHESIRANYKIVDQNKQITEINDHGIKLTQAQIDEFSDVILADLQADDIVLIAGNSHPENYQQVIEVARKIRTITNNLIIDIAQIDLGHIQELKPLVIKPNSEEILTLFKEKTEFSIDEYGEKLLKMGISYPIITRGEQGSVAFLGDEIYETKNQSLKVLNTVGAGDSYIAGLIYGLSQKFEFIDSLRYATSCAYVSIESDRKFSKSAIEKWIPNIQINKRIKK